MKKTIFLFTLLVLTLFSSCTKTNELVEISHSLETNPSVTIVTKKSTYSSTQTTIGYTITNPSGQEVCIAGDLNCFELHQLVDGQWKRVNTKKEHYWNELGLILQPNQTEEREINLAEYFYLPLEQGTYRIGVEGVVSNTFTIE